MVSIFVLLGVSIFFYSCSDNPTSPTGTGILQVSMTDAPAAYNAVYVWIDSVQAHIANGNTVQGWYTLNNKPHRYDLTTLVNGATTIIGTDTLPAGRYSQIRLYLGPNDTIVVDGQPQPLTVPSEVQTGIKLNVDANLQAGTLYNITLDFDAGKSIVVSGTLNNYQYTLKPVIRSGANATTAIISGKVFPYSFTSSVEAISDIDTASTFTDDMGGFKLIYLTPGTYNVYIYPDNTSYKVDTLKNIQVNQGETKDLGTVDLTQ